MSLNIGELAWNSVDVRGADGLLHSGRVVDCAEGGLVVHFGGTGDAGSRVIPMGDVYVRKDTYLLSVLVTEISAGRAEKLGASVEVLVRVRPEEPWKWYPGEVLDALGLVRVTLPGGQVTGVAREDRVRRPFIREPWSRVAADGFVRRAVAVPVELAAGLLSDEQLMATFNAHCRQRGYFILASQVLDIPIKTLMILEDVRDSYWLPDTCQYLSRENWLRCMLEWVRSIFECIATSLSAPPAPSMLCPDHDGHIQSLYRDPTIFPAIFHCLTTVQQSTLRRVSRPWDMILVSARISGVLVWRMSRRMWQSSRGDMYQLAACLYHCWTQQTRMLLLCDAGKDHLLDRVARLLPRIGAAKGLPTGATLVLGGHWKYYDLTGNWITALSETFLALARVCRKVVLKEIRLELTVKESDRNDCQDLTIRSLNQHLTGHLTASDFCGMLNNPLRDLDAQDKERVAEWIAGSSDSDAQAIAQVLNITQTLDPRDGVRYRGMTFAPYGDTHVAGVEIGHLTKLTLLALRSACGKSSAGIID